RSPSSRWSARAGRSSRAPCCSRSRRFPACARARPREPRCHAGRVLLQACLNGDRTEPQVPKSAAELAAAAAACVAAGARSLHCHPRDGDGRETLAPADVAAAVHAIRVAAPRTELSLSTGLWIAGDDVDARARAIAGWTERPDLVSVNVSEEG